MALTLIIITAFIIWFIILWTLIVSMLSMISGWKKLSSLYPADSSVCNGYCTTFRFSSIRLGLISYNNIAAVILTETGIILRMIKIFSFMHRPIFIPYEKITDIDNGGLFITRTGFRVSGKKILIYGKAGNVLFSRLQHR